MGFFSKKSEDPPPYHHPFEEVIAGLLKKEGYRFEYNDDYQVFELNLKGQNCQFRTIVYYNERQAALVIR